MSELHELPTFDLATLGARGRSLHVIVETRTSDLRDGHLVPVYRASVAACGAAGLPAHEERGVDARAIRVKGRDVCAKCLTTLDRDSTERRATAAASSLAGRPEPRSPNRREQDMAAQSGQRKRAAARRSSPTRARSAAAPAAERQAPTGEKGAEILAALLSATKDEVGTFEKKERVGATRLVLKGMTKGFAEFSPPRTSSLHVKIPSHLASVESKLPKGHGFKASPKGWGLTRTLTTAKEAALVAKCFKVAADAIRPPAEEAEAQS